MSSHKRLKFIANLINKNENILDVGTDHCFVPILLLKSKIIKKATATDINESPLSIAKSNLKKENLEKKVKLILTNGLENIKINNFNVIIIAGMGGHTIYEIIKKKTYNGRYILHPTNSLPKLRKEIMNSNMKITNEYIIRENEIFNVILEVVKGKQKLSLKEIYMGPILIKKNNELVSQYYKSLLFKLNHIKEKSGQKQIYEKEIKWLNDWLY